jgi:hypothetical protein
VIVGVAVCVLLNIVLVVMLVTGKAFGLTRREQPRRYWALFIVWRRSTARWRG